VNPLSIKEQHVARLQAAGARHGAGRRRRSPGVLQKLHPFLVAVAPEVEPVLVDLHKLRGRSLVRQRNNIGQRPPVAILVPLLVIGQTVDAATALRQLPAGTAAPPRVILPKLYRPLEMSFRR